MIPDIQLRERVPLENHAPWQNWVWQARFFWHDLGSRFSYKFNEPKRTVLCWCSIIREVDLTVSCGLLRHVATPFFLSLRFEESTPRQSYVLGKLKTSYKRIKPSLKCINIRMKVKVYPKMYRFLFLITLILSPTHRKTASIIVFDVLEAGRDHSNILFCFNISNIVSN